MLEISLKSLVFKTIQILHLCLILFVLFAPLSSDKRVLEFHMQLVLFLLFKWWANGGKCNLTEIEYKLRGVAKEEGFIYSFLQPVIELRENEFNYLIYAGVIILALISYVRYRQK